jgi:hypothetical protein
MHAGTRKDPGLGSSFNSHSSSFLCKLHVADVALLVVDVCGGPVQTDLCCSFMDLSHNPLNVNESWTPRSH